jgi:hypothetical protein
MQRKRLGSELNAYVIVVQKRQWPHAGTSLGTGGGAFFYFLNILEAFFAWGGDLLKWGRGDGGRGT